MRLQIPLIEIQQFLSKQYDVDIVLKNIEENKIEATYIDSVVLMIKEIKDEIILIHYEVDGLAHIVTAQLNAFLKIICISEIQFTNNAVVLEMYVRGKI